MFEIEMDERPAASIKVVGCGGGGGNALNRMVDCGVTGVDSVSYTHLTLPTICSV